MASPSVLPLAELLAPLSQGGPSGMNIRDVGMNPAGRVLYDSIRSLRNQARQKERQIAGDPAASVDSLPEWPDVFDKSVAALSTRSKDLEIAMYLIEAAVRLHHFAGLRDSLALYRGLINQFWDSLYPRPGDDGVAGRVAGIAGLNGDATREGFLLFPILRVPLTDGNGGKFGLFHYQCALALDKLPRERQEERIRTGLCSLQMFEESVRQTPVDKRRRLFADLTQCIAELDQLGGDLTRHCAADAPPTSRIGMALRECRQIVEKVGDPPPFETSVPPLAAPAREPGPVAIAHDATEAENRASEADPAKFRNREEAFAAVLRAAAFFRANEPMSPVSFALEKAVRWGNLPLPELLAELIADESARKSVFHLIGIQPDAKTEG